MKFKSRFKLPKHQQFKIIPRHYDPIKEEIEIRTKKMENQLNGSKIAHYDSNIRGSFRRNVTRKSNIGLLRLVVLVVLLTLLILWGFEKFVAYI